MATRAKEYYWITTWAMVCLTGLYCLGLRIYLTFDLPLWLDESWTAVLSATPSLRSFTREMWLDNNAPLYYFMMWLWPFESNFGLRVPSILFLAAAAVVAVCWRAQSITRKRGLLWASLLLTWAPGIVLFLDARYYALLFLISTVQAIAYLKLLENPTLARAFFWTAISSLAVLTHYYAALPALIQGLFYIGHHRRTAVAAWPTLMFTLPVLAWGIYHLPRLLFYAQPGNSFYARLPLELAPSFLIYGLGASVASAAITLLLLALFWKHPPRNVWVMVAAAVTASLILVFIGLLTPSIIGRYLLPVVPSTLLGVAVSIRRVGYLPLAAWFLLNAGGIGQWEESLSARALFGLELPVRELPGSTSITWRLDGSAANVFDRKQMESLLIDALARNGRESDVHWGQDLSASDGLIWFTQNNPSQAARALGAGWRCRDISKGYHHRTIICARGRPPTSRQS